MANATTTQILIDGPRNVVCKFEGQLDTSDLSNVTVLDPATLTGMDNTGTLKAAKLRIEDVQFIVEDKLAVTLFWNANTPVHIEDFEGRGHAKYYPFGGLVNNAGAGVDGKITASTEGAAPGTILSFSLILKCIKTQ